MKIAKKYVLYITGLFAFLMLLVSLLFIYGEDMIGVEQQLSLIHI